MFFNSVVRDKSKPFYNKLKKVGVYHTSPISAARHLNNIYDSVNDWGFSSYVQEAKNLYCEEFVRSDEKYLNSYVKIIKKIYK